MPARRTPRRIAVARKKPSKIIVRRRVPTASQDWHPEQGLISAVLKAKDMVNPIGASVTADWFHAYYDEWDFIARFYQRHRHLPSVAVFLRKFPEFDLARTNDVDYFIEEVREAHARFVLLTTMEQITDGLRDDEPINKLVRRVEVKLIELQGQISGSSNQSDLVADSENVLNEIRARLDRSKKTGLAGMPLGFPTLEEVTGGPQPGEYWVVAARLGQGKTWTLLRMACANLIAGNTVQYDALEQSRNQIHMRAHNFLSSIYGREVFRAIDLMQGRNFDLLEYKRFIKRLEDELPGSLMVDDTSRGGVTTATIAAQIERNKPDILFLDYLGLMDAGAGDWQSMKALSADMKGIAMQYQTPIICAAQINRMGMGKEPPGPEHIAGSDAIGQDVDAVITLKKYSKRVIRMRLAKYRHGPDQQMWWCKFSLNTGQYEEITGNEAQDLIEEDKEEDE